ncbi:MAG: N-acetylneuraminate synthase [Candidatus Marinimicrobia bacterium]|nr:N-acetylneuraminate synthase [Candidatus Neomarinimicrobiota bacterium]|tara:strand:+ start:3580 stop:4626 length:1047 start_codon:yes stop_codon:yes gene_type:complete
MLKLSSKKIGKNFPPLIVAEIAQAHDGSLGIANSYIDAVADAGADCIKFQTHYASEESTFDDQFRVNFSTQDKTRYDYWKRMEFSKDEWRQLSQHANKKNLLFLSSAFSQKALELLFDIGLPAVKIASGEISNRDMLDYAIEKNLPVILSTGMSNWKEIDNCVKYLNDHNIAVVIMQCTTEYPTPLNHVGLNVIDQFKKAYPNNYFGLSDHSGTLYPSFAAISKGIDLIEVHVTFDKRMFGPDTKSSITIEELKLLCDYRDGVHEMTTNPVDKNEMAKKLSDVKKLFSKSLAPSRPLKKGTIIKKEMLQLKKPGTGLSYNKINEIIGKCLIKDVNPDYLLKLEDFVEQ